MFEIDKAKFGAFISELRKEKKITQKELAEKLYISDKAISKWETGHSIPDVALLVPLAEILGISVTELLECERKAENTTMESAQTNQLVQDVIALTEKQYGQKKKRNIMIYLLCVFVSLAELFCIYKLDQMGKIFAVPYVPYILPTALIAIIFGVYVFVFIKDRLPAYYDENSVSIYVDGPLHMNMPGVYFNNNNWPYIVKALRGWCIASMTVFPIICPLLGMVLQAVSPNAMLWAVLILYLGGLFVPVYVLGRKYRYGENSGKQDEKSRSGIGYLLFVVGLILLVLFGTKLLGIGSVRSGTRLLFFSNEGKDYWNASYQYFDGYVERTLWLDEDGVLVVEVETETGTVTVEIKDENGMVLATETCTEDKIFEVEASGKVRVRIQGEGHKGGFNLSFQEAGV